MPEVQFLLMQATYGNFHWSPPKGHVKPGETDYEAAIRETKEEAGLSDSVLAVMYDFKIELRYNVTNRWNGKKRDKRTMYWLAELLKPAENSVVMSREHQDFKWLTLQEAKDLSGFKDFNEALDKCYTKIIEQ